MSIVEYSNDIASQEAPPALPPGDYPAEIVGADQKVSANSGNNYLALTLMINPNDYPADFIEGDADGTRLSYNRLLLEDTPRARWRVRQFYEAVGITPPGRQLDTSDLMGLQVSVKVKHTQFEGETRAEIDRIGAR